MNPDLFWLPGPWQGRLAIMTRPRGGDWLEEEINGWSAAGLDMIVSLLEPDEAEQLGLKDERSLTELKGLEFVSFPIPDRGVPSSSADAMKLLGGITRVLDTGKNVAVHCRQSIGRSGLIAAAALMMAGMETRKAVHVVSSARGLPVPETSAQLQWLNRMASEQFAVVK